MTLIGDRFMSWINDVKIEIKNLDTSKKQLKNFGIVVGTILLIIGIWIFFKSGSIFSYIFGIAGLILIIGGLIFPKNLLKIYKFWMGIAFALGWLVSRIILVFLFYIIVTPIGLIARLFNKKFMDIDYKQKGDSYWIPKSKSHNIDYEKMY